MSRTATRIYIDIFLCWYYYHYNEYVLNQYLIVVPMGPIPAYPATTHHH